MLGINEGRRKLPFFLEVGFIYHSMFSKLLVRLYPIMELFNFYRFRQNIIVFVK